MGGRELLCDAFDFAAEVGAAVDLGCAACRMLKAALMNQEDDCVDALALQRCCRSVGDAAFFFEAQTAYGRRGDNLRRALQGFADEADLHAAHGPDGRGWIQGVGRAVVAHYVCGQVLVVGGFGLRAGLAGVLLEAAAVEAAVKLHGSVVHFVVADGGDRKMHGVQRLDGGFIVERRRRAAGTRPSCRRHQTRIVLGVLSAARRRRVARYSTPPAGTPLTRPSDPEGGSRLP